MGGGVMVEIRRSSCNFFAVRYILVLCPRP